MRYLLVEPEVRRLGHCFGLASKGRVALQRAIEVLILVGPSSSCGLLWPEGQGEGLNLLEDRGRSEGSRAVLVAYLRASSGSGGKAGSPKGEVRCWVDIRCA